MYKYNEDYLMHYGVLGMKWGVRRYQPYPKGKHGTFLGQDRDNDIVIKKGSSAYRLQTGDKISGTGQMYVSFDKLDSLSYAAVSSSGEPGGLGVNMYDGSGNIITIKLTKDIVAPSYQKTMDAFIKTVDEIGVKQVARDSYQLNDKTIPKWKRYINKQEAKQFIKDYKHLTLDEARDRAYMSFSKSFMKDTKARTLFFESLKNDGYNALVDENDKKFENGFTKTPMIIFDRGDTQKVTSVSISEKDAEYFRDLYFNGDDTAYVKKYHGSTVEKWDKWAGTSERNGI